MSVDGFVEGEWSEVVTFRADGNVGVGTSDPLEPFHVVGNGFVEGELFVGPSSKTQFALGVDEAGALSLRDVDGKSAITVTTARDGSVGLGVGDAKARLQAQGASARSGNGFVSSLDGALVTGEMTAFLHDLTVGDVFTAGISSKFVQSIESDTELHLSSAMEPFEMQMWSYQKAITLLTNAEGATEFVVTANGNVGIGSWIADERLTIESSESNAEVADVLFRTSSSEPVWISDDIQI